MDELEIHFFIKNSRHMTSTNNPVAFPPFSMIPCIYGLSLGSICDIFVADLQGSSLTGFDFSSQKPPDRSSNTAG